MEGEKYEHGLEDGWHQAMSAVDLYLCGQPEFGNTKTVDGELWIRLQAITDWVEHVWIHKTPPRF